MEFSFGLEHEVALVDQAGSFLDFSRLKYADLDRIIEKLPLYPGDYDQLRVGDAGIKKKRWYIECFERCNCDEQVVDCIPKGLEIRTTIQPTIQAAVAELAESYALLVKAAHCFGYRPVCVGFNPYRVEFEPDPPLTDYERTMQEQSPSPETLTQFIPMVTYGPDLNLSAKALPIAQAIDIAQKLTYYSPCLVPFSLNAPFYGG
ncbi:MAG TPA: glutamate--cysteine ligase, partial [Anaerolineae bacterium]|nr:glutamate--cysteine ligase [Anaerolineae bacterium]